MERVGSDNRNRQARAEEYRFMASKEMEDTNVGCFKAMARKLGNSSLDPGWRAGAEFPHEIRRHQSSRRRSLDERLWGFHKTHPSESRSVPEIKPKGHPGHRTTSSLGDSKLQIELEEKSTPSPSLSTPPPESPFPESSQSELSPWSTSSGQPHMSAADSSSGEDLSADRDGPSSSKSWKKGTDNVHSSALEGIEVRERSGENQTLAEYKVEWSDFDRYGIDIDLFVGHSRLPPVDIICHTGLLQSASEQETAAMVAEAQKAERENSGAAERDELAATTDSLHTATGIGRYSYNLVGARATDGIGSESLDRFGSSLARTLSTEMGKEGGPSPLVRSWSLSANPKWRAGQGELPPSFQNPQTQKTLSPLRHPRRIVGLDRPPDSPRRTRSGVVKSLTRWLSGPVDYGAGLTVKE